MSKEAIYLPVEGLLPRNTKVTSTWLDHTKAIGKIVGYASLAEGNGDFQPAYLVELFHFVTIARDSRAPKGLQSINIITLRADRVMEVKDPLPLKSFVFKALVVKFRTADDKVVLTTTLPDPLFQSDYLQVEFRAMKGTGVGFVKTYFPDIPIEEREITSY